MVKRSLGSKSCFPDVLTKTSVLHGVGYPLCDKHFVVSKSVMLNSSNMTPAFSGVARKNRHEMDNDTNKHKTQKC